MRQYKFLYDGAMVTTSKALRLMKKKRGVDLNNKLSKDRIERVRGVKKDKKKQTEKQRISDNHDDPFANNNINLSTPLVLLLRMYDNRYTLLIGEVQALFDKGTLVTELPLEKLQEDTTVVGFRALQMTKKDDIVTVRPASSTTDATYEVDTSGCYVSPIAVTCGHEEASVVWRVEFCELENLLATLADKCDNKNRLQCIAPDYHGVLCTEEGGKDIALVHGKKLGTTTSGELYCKFKCADGRVCNFGNNTFKVGKVHNLTKLNETLRNYKQHTAAHLLCNEGAVGKCVRTPCQLCGTNVENGEKCKMKVDGNRVTITCYVGGTYEYKLGSACKSSTNSPCSNGPMKCLYCDKYFSKYNMYEHVKDDHNNMLENVFQITRRQEEYDTDEKQQRWIKEEEAKKVVEYLNRKKPRK